MAQIRRATARWELEGIDDTAFRALAEDAKENCPISQALKGNVALSVDAKLA